MIKFAKGTKVKWKLKDGGGGSGTCVADEDGGKVLVAVETRHGNGTECLDEMHFVIYCNTTWLELA